MNKFFRFRYLLTAYVALLIVMFLLPRYSVEGYSVLKNTTSHLGAQNAPFAWVMNTVFLLLGAACVMEGWLHLKDLWCQKLLLTVFGLGLVGLAFARHAPIVEGVPFSALEDQAHSVLATLIGFSFTILAFSAIFVAKAHLSRILALTAGCISVIISLLMFTLPDYTGILQRLMFIFAFAWLIFFLEEARTPA